MALTKEDVKTYFDQMEAKQNELAETMQELVDQQAKEIREAGGTMTKTKEAVESLEGRIVKLEGEKAELKHEFEVEIAKVAVVEKMLGRAGIGAISMEGGDMPLDEMKSVGQTFADSEQLKEMLERGANGSNRVEVKSILRSPERKAGTLTSAETGWGGMGPLWLPQELGETIAGFRRTFSIRDLLNVVPVASDAVHYVEETGVAVLYTEANAAAAAGATTLTVQSVSGLMIGQMITIGTATPQTVTITAINAGTQVITISVALAQAVVVGTPITSDQMAFIPHGGDKPQASMQFADRTLSIGTLAHWIAIHRQTLQDGPQLQAMVDNNLRYGLALAEEYQLMWGNGQAPNLTGLMVNANVPNQGARGADTQIDYVRKMLTGAELSAFPPNGIVMHPTSWQDIELLKDTTGQYLWANVQVQGRRVLFGIPVVTTIAMTAPNVLLGSFNLGAYLFDREQANVRISESHASFFTQNMVAVLAEQREGLGVVRPQAFRKGQF